MSSRAHKIVQQALSLNKTRESASCEHSRTTDNPENSIECPGRRVITWHAEELQNPINISVKSSIQNSQVLPDCNNLLSQENFKTTDISQTMKDLEDLQSLEVSITKHSDELFQNIAQEDLQSIEKTITEDTDGIFQRVTNFIVLEDMTLYPEYEAVHEEHQVDIRGTTDGDLDQLVSEEQMPSEKSEIPEQVFQDDDVLKQVTEINELNITASQENDNNQYENGQEELELEVVESSSSDGSFNAIETEYTKKGEQRKRKKFKYTRIQRQNKKIKKIKQNHTIRQPCNNSCRKKCSAKISQKIRTEINSQFWSMTKHDQRDFVISSVQKVGVKRKKVGADSRRKFSNNYFLKDDQGQSINVCRTFLLTTLGYHPNNDKILENMLDPKTSVISPRQDKRLGRRPPNIKNHQVIIDHIESFKPNISHYRREHAPLRRYLPSDLSAQKLYNDFLEKTTEFSCSYDLYRSILRKRNISFVKLGHEECEHCETFKLHEHSEENSQPECEVCSKWQIHKQKYTQARQFYEADKIKSQNSKDSLFVSVDLQKVIMLPRCEMFKSLIFTQRLVAYNESFVPLKSMAIEKPTAIVWHEAIRGRKKEDIISVFSKYIQSQRDRIRITFWVDNCSAQNKNWAFFSFLLFIVNSTFTEASEIEVNYFEPGHTFMSADSFHHSVEKSLKSRKKIYDFNDFKTAIEDTKAKTIEMTIQDFFLWKDHSKKYKAKDSKKVYLQDVVQVCAKRGDFFLSYRTDFQKPALPLDFLKNNISKLGKLPVPDPVSQPRGISKQRRDGIMKLIQNYSGGGNSNKIIPANRLAFWQNIPVNDESDNDEEN